MFGPFESQLKIYFDWGCCVSVMPQGDREGSLIAWGIMIKKKLSNVSASWGQQKILTHCGRVMHICISKLTIIGSDNGLSPGRRQAIIWSNSGILLIRSWGTTFSDILSKFRTFSSKKMHLKVSSAKWRPSCLGLNVLTCHITSSNIWLYCGVYSHIYTYLYILNQCDYLLDLQHISNDTH